jgi:hypothetical protein
MVLVFVTLLCSLCFSTLFYQVRRRAGAAGGALAHALVHNVPCAAP